MGALLDLRAALFIIIEQLVLRMGELRDVFERTDLAGEDTPAARMQLIPAPFGLFEALREERERDAAILVADDDVGHRARSVPHRAGRGREHLRDDRHRLSDRQISDRRQLGRIGIAARIVREHVADRAHVECALELLRRAATHGIFQARVEREDHS